MQTGGATFFKDKGNKEFKAKNFADAINYYSQAINYDSQSSVLFYNRGLCYLKLCQYTEALKDTQKAIGIDPKSTKGHYFSGKVHEAMGELVLAKKAYEKALTLAKEKKEDAQLVKSILHNWHVTKKNLWLKENDEKKAARRRVLQFVQNALDDYHEHKQASNAPSMLLEELQLKKYELESLFADNDNGEMPQVPDMLTCKITFEIMTDPVITPSGQTYDRQALLTHLQTNGYFDPVTREKCLPSELRTNFAIKEFVDHYLEQNPWAYDKMEAQ